jgi:hypothetical protein
MSTTPSEPGEGPGLEAFAGLVDDAATFPPRDATTADALRAHRGHRAAWYSPLVAGFVCADTRLPELQEALDAAGPPPERLRVNLTITGGAGAVEPALTWAGRDDRLDVAAVEVALRDEDDLARNVARMDTVLAAALPESATAYVEMPRLRGAGVPAGWARALDEVAAAGLRVKYRTGGADADAFPPAGELAAVLEAAVDREVPLKCTAGLHHAVRHTYPGTGFEHHWFLNVLLATRAVLDGAAAGDATAVLEERRPEVVGQRVRALGAAAVASTRRWFVSFGSCSVAEPVDDLAGLGLVAPGTRQAAGP